MKCPKCGKTLVNDVCWECGYMNYPIPQEDKIYQLIVSRKELEMIHRMVLDGDPSDLRGILADKIALLLDPI